MWHFKKQEYCAGEAGETEVWLDFAKDAEYMSTQRYSYFIENYDEVNRMLYSMIDKPGKFSAQKVKTGK